MSKIDLLIRNGTVVDGSGGIPFRADVGVNKGRISCIGSDCINDAEVVLNAEGLTVCPGFIDMHSHSDTSVQFDNRLESMIQQGVTTSVIGNCGSSLAPINDVTLELMRQELDVFSPPGRKLKITWRSFGEYLENLERIRIPLNMAPLVGFSAIRLAAGPAYENRSPTKSELANMKASVAEAMETGAFGMSTGLFYPPQSYASTNEVVELAKIVAKYNGLYFSHIRNEGAEVVQAVSELIQIVEKSGCRGGQIAHHKIAGQSYWGTSRDTLKLIEEANSRGLHIRCDQYPYNRGMTSLVSLLPPWVHEGGMESILDHLEIRESQKRIMRDVEAGVSGWENIIKEVGWQNIYIASVKTEKWREVQGRSLLQIADEYGYPDVFLLLFEILLDEEGEATMTIESMDEGDIKRIMKSKYTMIGTDGWGISATGPYSYTKPHPRSYGTYPRVLGKYVRDEGVLTLEEAIWKMTGFPAETLKLGDRGLIREGFCADIIIFDSNRIQDKATFIEPHQFPEGIHQVIVNGEIVVDDSEQLEVFPGRVLRGVTSSPN
ncbi:MAG: D-aminoacylase [Candidatus Thorarchaeota archaeon]|nr:D-aminoacylase [Candidatus Thorarchaeota archaeon]